MSEVDENDMVSELDHQGKLITMKQSKSDNSLRANIVSQQLPEAPKSATHRRRGITDESEPNSDNSIFSIDRSKGSRRRSHYDNVSCFPIGCMGVKKEEIRDWDMEGGDSIKVTEPVKKVVKPIKEEIKVSSTNFTRNPLTGAGCEQYEFMPHRIS